MKLSCLLVFVVCVGAVSEQDQHIAEVQKHIAPRVHDNGRFAELSAAVTVAQRAANGDQATGRSPIAEVAAMTDMLLIQNEHDMDHTTLLTHQLKAHCKKIDETQSTIISDKKILEKKETDSGDIAKAKWEAMLDDIPEWKRKMAQKDREIQSGEDKISDAQTLRTKQHFIFVHAVAAHDVALKDVRAIRLIIQKSPHDDKANKQATVSAGTKTATAPTTTAAAKNALVELKSTAHPRLHNLIQLAQRSLERQQTSAVDKIYELLYKVRDSLTNSKGKLIRNEAHAVSNWRTNKVAFRSDINDLRILKETYYMQLGVTRKKIGMFKRMEGLHRVQNQEEVTVRNRNEIDRDFKRVDCSEKTQQLNGRRLLLFSEQSSLKAVQAKLVTLKWSNKVYAAVQKVSEGITYLKGEYNIRSQLGRYMVNVASDPKFEVVGKQTVAEKFRITQAVEDDTCNSKEKKAAPECSADPDFTIDLGLKVQLAYKVISVDAKKVFSYLTEMPDGSVKFLEMKDRIRLQSNLKSYWDFEFDSATGTTFIRNRHSKNTLFVDAGAKYSVTTGLQSTDTRSQFLLETGVYSYEGCYKNKLGKQLETYAGASNTQNIDNCLATCLKKMAGTKFKYFGLTEANQCFCGNNFHIDSAPDSDCGYLCPNRGGQICGGKQRTSIYKYWDKDPKPVLVSPKPVPVAVGLVKSATKPATATKVSAAATKKPATTR